jgi:hypothetical protein
MIRCSRGLGGADLPAFTSEFLRATKSSSPPGSSGTPAFQPVEPAGQARILVCQPVSTRAVIREEEMAATMAPCTKGTEPNAHRARPLCSPHAAQRLAAQRQAQGRPLQPRVRRPRLHCATTAFDRSRSILNCATHSRPTSKVSVVSYVRKPSNDAVTRHFPGCRACLRGCSEYVDHSIGFRRSGRKARIASPEIGWPSGPKASTERMAVEAAPQGRSRQPRVRRL